MDKKNSQASKSRLRQNRPAKRLAQSRLSEDAGKSRETSRNLGGGRNGASSNHSEREVIDMSEGADSSETSDKAGRKPNRLINEQSPYLRQHAYNPVDWYPWGKEALARARQENKPILLSIGYSACHWCHVMERESFENDAIAQLMNANFVSIKVDREERPDLDHIYMDAVQLLTGRGGWPLTMFLTPDGQPFYGGTYFPPADRHGLPGFPRVLGSIANAYFNQPQDVLSNSNT